MFKKANFSNFYRFVGALFGALVGSPARANNISQCGHILHIDEHQFYLKGEQTTIPSLCINFDGTAWFANMGAEQTQMYSNLEHYLQIEYNNATYYVYDDTICEKYDRINIL